MGYLILVGLATLAVQQLVPSQKTLESVENPEGRVDLMMSRALERIAQVDPTAAVAFNVGRPIIDRALSMTFGGRR